jgi:sec-independent protein translocase protein TatA
MGSFSIWHWLIVLVVVLVLFGGRGKVSQLMGDFGTGLKAFKKSLKDDDEPFEDRSLTEREAKALEGDARRNAETETATEKDRAARS